MKKVVIVVAFVAHLLIKRDIQTDDLFTTIRHSLFQVDVILLLDSLELLYSFPSLFHFGSLFLSQFIFNIFVEFSLNLFNVIEEGALEAQFEKIWLRTDEMFELLQVKDDLSSLANVNIVNHVVII